VAAEEDSSLGELWPECLALTDKRRGTDDERSNAS